MISGLEVVVRRSIPIKFLSNYKLRKKNDSERGIRKLFKTNHQKHPTKKPNDS